MRGKLKCGANKCVCVAYFKWIIYLNLFVLAYAMDGKK